MTSDFFEASPMSTLSASIRGGLAPGQLGMVLARAGVGKSPFLVHIALSHLIRGTEVLHVSLHDQAAHVRSFYQEILGELLRDSGADPGAMEAEVERNRVIHSFLTGSFTPERLSGLLATLDEVMDFRPAVVVIDGSCVCRVGLIQQPNRWWRITRGDIPRGPRGSRESPSEGSHRPAWASPTTPAG